MKKVDTNKIKKTALKHYSVDELIEELLTRNGEFLLIRNWYYKENIREYFESFKENKRKNFNIEKAMKKIKKLETHYNGTDDYEIFSEIIDEEIIYNK